MELEKLQSLYTEDPSSAIEESQKIIFQSANFSSFQEFITHHSKNPHFLYCPKPFTAEYKFELSVFCLDCAINNDDLCFICLPCFLDGKHEGHTYFIFPGLVGNCACGDKNHMKTQGFCTKHHSCDDEHLENYIDEKLQKNLTSLIFKASLLALQTFSEEDYRKVILIIQFLITLFDLGDGFRRLFTKTLVEEINFKDLIINIPNYNCLVNSCLIKLISYLMNDQLFMKNFSKNVYSLIFERIIEDSPNCMVKAYDDVSYNDWFSFFYQCFQEPISRYNIEYNNWDWISFDIKLLTYFKDLFCFVKNQKYKSYPLVFSIIKNMHFITSIQPNEQTQQFFDKIVTEVFNSGTHENTKGDANDCIITVSFKRFAFISNFKSFYDFLSFFYYLFDCFKSKPNLKLDKLIEELDEKIDISPIFVINKNYVGKENGKKNENDRLISRFIKDPNKEDLSFFDKFKSTMKSIFQPYPLKFYKSIFNGGSFFLSYPLYDMFCFLFKVDELCRIKIAQFISMEKYQTLRIKLGIITMKKLLSIFNFDLSIANIYSSSLIEVYEKIHEFKKEARYNFMPVSILQLLIGLQCNEKVEDEFIIKEFFAFELAREFGLFDNVYREKNQVMIFGFFYTALLLVIDRSLFHNDGRKVIEEQLIFVLKKGIHSIDQLNELCDRNDRPGDYFSQFNEILMKVSTKSTSNDNNLKDEDNDNETNISLEHLKNFGNHANDEDEEEEEEGEINNSINDVTMSSDLRNEINQINNNRKETQNSYIKPVNFYLKEGIECKVISSIIPINLQKSYMNVEVSKNKDKLLKIQDFEPEETYFFNSTNENSSNDNNNDDNESIVNSDGLNIRLKRFLLTPTVLAVVYDSLRKAEQYESQEINLNDHLALNILILASRFIKENDEQTPITNAIAFNIDENITYASLADLISKIKRFAFNYRTEGKGDEEKAFIEDTLNSTNFASFLKIKFAPENLPPKSFIDVLIEKGQIGQEALKQISLNIRIDDINEEKEKENLDEVKNIKTIQKQKANKLKEDIMNQYSNIRNQYHFSDSIAESFSLTSSELFSPNKKVCSLCSESKKTEILSYPLYIYPTKLPFIFDKPPLVSNDVKDISVYDNEEDFDNDPDFVSFVKEDIEIGEEQQEVDISSFQKTISNAYDLQQKERKELNIGKEKMKRVTAGANFIVQFGICPHPVHKSCVEDENTFICPIDRSTKNGFLPCLDDISISKIFKDTQTFELLPNALRSNIVESIQSFVNKFRSFYDCLNSGSLNVFVEFIKSISGLIGTYEIRVRNLPNSLDSIKTKILSRNLFLSVWYAYRIQKKPKLTIMSRDNSLEIDAETRFTEFQKFTKMLIESDNILNDPEEFKRIVSYFTDSFSSSINDKNIKRKEKELCLFLKRVCLAEYFILDSDLDVDKKELIDWDDILTTDNLAKRYNVEFKSIDLSKNEEFEFKPFVFTNFPKEFLKLAQSPYNLPIQNIGEISLYSLLEYNYLIKYYNDFDDVEDESETDLIYENTTTNDDSHENEENNNESNNESNTNSNKNNNSVINEENNNNKESDTNNESKNCSGDDNECDCDCNDLALMNEIKKNRRAVQFCDVEFLSYFMTFYGKRRYPSILMFTGAIASQIFIVDQSSGASLDTFYVDKSGCPDVNHMRFQPLFLNEERYEKLIDQILSGDFSYNLESLEKLRDTDEMTD